MPTVPYGIVIAIQHTDGDKVIQSKVVFGSLRQPVRFIQMGNTEKKIEVSIVMMMALKTAHDQTSMLQKMMEIFQIGLSVKTNEKGREHCESAEFFKMKKGAAGCGNLTVVC